MLPPRIFFQKISIWRADSSCILNSSKPGPDGRLAPTGSGTVIGEPGGPQLLLVKDLLAVEEGPLRIRDGGGIGWRMTGIYRIVSGNRVYSFRDHLGLPYPAIQTGPIH